MGNFPVKIEVSFINPVSLCSEKRWEVKTNDSEEVKKEVWLYWLVFYSTWISTNDTWIVNHVPNYGKTKQRGYINQFALQLVDLWQRAFGIDVLLVTIGGIKKS